MQHYPKDKLNGTQTRGCLLFMSLRSQFSVVIFVTISSYKRYSVRLYVQLFVGGRISYLRYSCLFAYSGLQYIQCCVFVLFFFVLCTPCCQFLWNVHFWSTLRYSLAFPTIYCIVYSRGVFCGIPRCLIFCYVTYFNCMCQLYCFVFLDVDFFCRFLWNKFDLSCKILTNFRQIYEWEINFHKNNNKKKINILCKYTKEILMLCLRYKWSLDVNQSTNQSINLKCDVIYVRQVKLQILKGSVFLVGVCF